MSAPIEIQITVEPAPATVNQVAGALRAAGIHVTSVLEGLGIITAQCDEQRMSDVSKIEGVKRVERRGGYKIPPPGSPIQ